MRSPQYAKLAQAWAGGSAVRNGGARHYDDNQGSTVIPRDQEPDVIVDRLARDYMKDHPTARYGAAVE